MTQHIENAISILRTAYKNLAVSNGDITLMPIMELQGRIESTRECICNAVYQLRNPIMANYSGEELNVTQQKFNNEYLD